MQHTASAPNGQSSARRLGRRLKPRTPPPPYTWTDDEDYSVSSKGDDGGREQDSDGDLVDCDGEIEIDDSDFEDKVDEVKVDFTSPDDIGEHDDHDDARQSGLVPIAATAPVRLPKRRVLGMEGDQTPVHADDDDDEDDANEDDERGGSDTNVDVDEDEEDDDDDDEDDEDDDEDDDEEGDLNGDDDVNAPAAAQADVLKPTQLRESPLAMIAPGRREEFGLIGSAPNPFARAELWTDDEQGEEWRVCCIGRHWLAVERPPIGEVTPKPAWGPAAERLLWAIHSLVITAKCSLVVAADLWLAECVWGKRVPPRHWLGDLRRLLEGLTHLHVLSVRTGRSHLRRGTTELLATVRYLKSGTPDVACDECCPCHGARHGHFVIETGKHFLGGLEHLGQCVKGLTRGYDFTFPRSKSGRRKKGEEEERPSLRTIGKKYRITSAFLPAKLGAPEACRQFSAGQHRIIQALITEMTRAAKRTSDGVSVAEVISSGSVVSFSGRGRTRCPLLDVHHTHVGFNGNGRQPRRARGYKIASAGGWMFKAGYLLDKPDQLVQFLDDLNGLREPLGISVVGVGRGPADWFTLDQLRGLATTPSGRMTLARLTLRVYADADYLQKWATLFQWTTPATRGAAAAVESMGVLKEAMLSMSVTIVELANGIGRNPAYLYKVFQGRKPLSCGLREKIREYLAHRDVQSPQLPVVAVDPGDALSPDMPPLDHALAYHRLGWNVIPMRMREKKPFIEWKSLQTRRITEREIRDWWDKWPDAGIGLVLGPVSGVIAIDSDGPLGRAALVKHLGAEPTNAPKTISGSAEPDHFHLLFRCPAIATRSKFTPWHKKLEFRGEGGLGVLPYSTHSSGRTYRWAEGRSPWELSLPPVPPKVLAALSEKSQRAHPMNPVGRITDLQSLTGSNLERLKLSTRQFLAGKFAHAAGEWDERLFRAACDMSACNIAVAFATPLLLAGAQPVETKDERIALATIRSAFSKPREQSRS